MVRRQIFEHYLYHSLNHAYRFAYTYTKNAADAEDIVSDSVEKALTHLGTLHDPKKIHPWFFRIVANTAKSFLRQRSKITYLDTALENEDSHCDTYHFSELDFFIRSLDEKYKEVIVLRFFEDLRIHDIAMILDENENTIKTRLYKALKLLKIDLEKEGYGL